MVPICGAANPDTKGLLHPLLRRYAVYWMPDWLGWHGLPDEFVSSAGKSIFDCVGGPPSFDSVSSASLTYPLLCRYQAKRCSYFVFSLPAVQVLGLAGVAC